MRLLVTAPGSIYTINDVDYYTNMVYGNQYYNKYTSAFEEVIRVGKTLHTNDVTGMLKINDDTVSVCPIPETHGFTDYIKKKKMIEKIADSALLSCDAAALRIPDPLSFHLINTCLHEGIPFIVEITTDVWTYLAPGNNKSKIRPLLRLYWHYLQKRACKIADGVNYVTKKHLQARYPSSYSLGRSQKRYFESAYTDVDVPERMFAKSHKTFSGKLSTVKIVHVSGSLSYDAKGYYELIHSVSELISEGFDIKLILVGGDDLNPELLKYIEKQGIGDSIEKTGRISERYKLFSVLRNSDLFVFPSYTEGLPRVVIEAMINALPVIASNIPGNAELINKDALVPVRNTEELKNKIKYFILNPSVMEEHSIENLNRAYEYSMEANNKMSKEFYLKLRRNAELGRANK